MIGLVIPSTHVRHCMTGTFLQNIKR